MQDVTTAPTSPKDHFESALAELLLAEERGEPLHLSRVLRTSPELETPLREFFRARDGFDRLAPCLAPEMPAGEAPGVVGRYHLVREIARGGMGAIIQGRDTDLGRDVVVKVLLGRHKGRTELVGRFLEEAQIAGQLQHPGIVPVYEKGQFPDNRPFFSMKLVKGQTLARLLHDRKAPGEDLTRFVGVFEQVCQTLAYAHARGVIHRDLKPANVMVGAFGEVQVMDWGLAKVLGQGGIADELQAQEKDLSVIQIERSAGSQTQAGTVMCTPAYAAPEQARGEIDRIDERADVFGLGAILCEVLTGNPPFLGKNAEARRQAENADLAGAFTRLDDCGADGELIALAKRCLAAQPAERPRHAAEVAMAVTAYQRSVTERLRQAEMDRAQAQVKAQEERKRRKLTVGLAAAVLALVVLGAGGGLFLQQKQAERLAEQARQETERQQAVLSALDKSTELQKHARWTEARVVLEQAQQRLGAAEAQELHQRIAQGLADLQLVSQLDAIRLEASAIVDGRFDDAGADRKYGEAFQEAKLAAPGEGPEVVAQRIRRSGIRSVLVAALDDWAVRARDQKRRDWALEVTRLADPDDWRNRFRDPKVRNNKAALETLAAQARVEELSPQILFALGVAVERKGGDATALLRRGQERHPDDFWLSFELGSVMSNSKEEGAEGYLRAALALRPRSSIVHHNLGYALHQRGKADEAIASFRKAIDLDPNYANAHNSLGNALADKGKVEEAIGHYRKAIEFHPKFAPAHNNLGLAMKLKGKVDEAIACYRKAIAIEPKYAQAHYKLGLALAVKGKMDEAFACYRKAIEVDPKNAPAHYNLGVALHAKGKVQEAIDSYREAIALDPKFAPARNSLGNALTAKGQVEEAIACYRKAIELDPKNALAHNNLGHALSGKGKVDEAIACFQKAIALDPKSALAHLNLGVALKNKGEVEEAIACYRKAIALDPRYAQAHVGLGSALFGKGKVGEAIACWRKAIELGPKDALAHYNLGVALHGKRKVDEAIACFRKAIAINPKLAQAHYNLGVALYGKGKVEEAIDSYRKAIELDPRYPFSHGALGQALRDQGRFAEAETSARRALHLLPQGHPLHAGATRLLQQCQFFQAQEKKLLDVLAGKAKPASVAEQLQFAQLCLMTRRFASGAQFYAEAFKTEAKQAENLSLGHRYNAARSAALAGCGKGHHAEKLDDKEAIRWRKQAREWLRADLALLTKQGGSGKARDQAFLATALRHWLDNPHLAGVRDKEVLAKLPEEERKEWQKLWSDVTNALQQASSKK